MRLTTFIMLGLGICQVAMPQASAEGRRGQRDITRQPPASAAERAPLACPVVWLKAALAPASGRAMGRRNYNDGDYADAALAFQQALRENQRDHRSWHDLGMSYFRMQQYLSAGQAFIAAYDIQKDADYLYKAALSQYNAGEVRCAAKSANQLLLDHREHGRGWKLLGRCHEAQNLAANARLCYERALKLMPYDGEVKLLLELLPAPVATETGATVVGADTLLERQVRLEVPGMPQDSPMRRAQSGLPMAKILDEEIYGDAFKAVTGDLPAIENVYHLNSDEPQQSGLKPTEEVILKRREMPAPTPKQPLEDL